MFRIPKDRVVDALLAFSYVSIAFILVHLFSPTAQAACTEKCKSINCQKIVYLMGNYACYRWVFFGTNDLANHARFVWSDGLGGGLPADKMPIVFVECQGMSGCPSTCAESGKINDAHNTCGGDEGERSLKQNQQDCIFIGS